MLTRRATLGAIAGTVVFAACSNDDRPAGPNAGTLIGGDAPAVVRYAYGTDASQFAELHLPAGERRAGTIVIIHGGFWRAEYALDLGTPLAADLARRGWAAWNLEYRRVGARGGWPETFEDVSAGIDALTAVSESIDLDRVVAIGHSAGGHLAAWAAARRGLPAGAPGHDPAVTVTGVISQAGVLDLQAGVAAGLGNGAVVDLMGASPEEEPGRYDVASPIERLPIDVPVRCVHGRGDDIVPLDQSQRYVEAAVASGDDAELVEVEGDHFVVLDVSSPAWETTIALVESLT